MERTVGVILSALAGAVLLTGCGGGDATTTTSTAADTTASAGVGWRSYVDPSEPTGATGPDIRSVAVSDDATDVRFRVRFASTPPLQSDVAAGWSDMLLVGIDVPPIGPVPKPDEWRGVDYVVGMHGGQTEVRFRAMKASGPQLTRLPATTDGPLISFAVPRAMLGNPARFVFNVAAGREGGPDENAGDLVPGSGTYSYVLSPAAR